MVLCLIARPRRLSGAASLPHQWRRVYECGRICHEKGQLGVMTTGACVRISVDHSRTQPARAAPRPDCELVRACIDGVPSAWEELVTRYGRLVYLVPQRYRLPPEVCDDVFQEVFLAALRHLPELRDAATLPKWLMVTAHRECCRAVRGRALPMEDHQVDLLLHDDRPPEEQLFGWEMQAAVHEALTALGGRCERLLRTLFLEPLPGGYAEAAEKLGMPIGSIGPVRNRCLARLLALLPPGLRRRD
jgi:RNA polymerase sigma factor (sigma-70 family)